MKDKALQLADRLDLYATGDKHQKDIEQAAAELRRPRSVNADLLEALKELVAHTDGRLFAVKHDHFTLQNARAAIAKATGDAA